MSARLLSVLAAVCGLLSIQGAVRGQGGAWSPDASCQPSWKPIPWTIPGDPGSVSAFAVFDDGHGPALYVGGSFDHAGSVAANGVAKWDGSNWSALGSGVDGAVSALAVFDDGSGPALYVGGGFTTAGGVSANRIARWDGANWSAVGSGFTNPGASVSSLVVFDDGHGPALYAGGWFTSAGGVAVNKIAKWDGASWSALGSGFASEFADVQCLAVFDDGAGPALYVGGRFSSAGGTTAKNVARWDGASWSALGSGVSDEVMSLAVFDDGNGPALYAGGYFPTAGGITVNSIAKWNGSAWSALGDGITSGSVRALTSFDDGTGPALYAAGDFYCYAPGGFDGSGNTTYADEIARWAGGSWHTVGSGIDSGYENFVAECVAGADLGSGPTLYVGGRFTLVGKVPVNSIAKWQSPEWSSVGTGVTNKLEPGSHVGALAVADNASGPVLCAGYDESAPGAPLVVQYNDSGSWTLPNPFTDYIHYVAAVQSLAVFDDGGGPALYVGGALPALSPSESSIGWVLKWAGSAWSAVGSVIVPSATGVDSLVVFDDGTGPALYAGGSWWLAIHEPDYGYVARWNGSTWTQLGGSMNLPVRALAVFDDGSGPALYAAGDFRVADALNHVARWDGSHWLALGSGTDGNVTALAVFDDGTGPALYAGGTFTQAGDAAANNVARWDGTRWSALGAGTDGSVKALVVSDDGTGPALYAAGTFATAGQTAASDIARWDGANWSPLGNGVSGSVFSLAVFDDGHGPALYAGGHFHVADSGGNDLAKWGGCPVPPSPWVNLGFALPGVSGAPALVGHGALIPDTTGSLMLSHAAPKALSVLFVSLDSTPMPFKGGTLVPLPVALQLPLSSNALGSLPLTWTGWPTGLSGLELYFQYAIKDAAAPAGVALSNALRADVP